MSQPYTQFADLLREVEPPPDGTLSRTIHQDERLKAVLFGFAAGQELSEHTSSRPAVMHFLRDCLGGCYPASRLRCLW
jgi:quercetin dioxygenase-like cupin family protein